tara:strand:+ start:563 stop:1357 length:795 start_codon:yes stop_codon:yes gene_type:complete
VIELEKVFNDRKQLVKYVNEISPWLQGSNASSIMGGISQVERQLQDIDPIKYCRTRNFLNGKVTKLSPYIRHGMLTLDRLRNEALTLCKDPQQIEKFIQELAWRDYWQRIYQQHPNYVWDDIESYKTGFRADEYEDGLPEDIATANTGVACIDQFIKILLQTGYMHNHTRMYVAAYVVHWRRIKWQAGAKWFLHHLIDGDPASNNFSWQWVASTFSNKPYIFNLDNVRKYAHAEINTNSNDNVVLDASYEILTLSLFPNKGMKQ